MVSDEEAKKSQRKYEGWLTESALKIRRLEKMIIKFVTKNQFEEIWEPLRKFLDLKKEISTRIMGVSVVKVHDKEAQKILSKISDGGKFYPDIIYEKMGNIIEEKISTDIIELLSDDEIWWIYDEEYLQAVDQYEFVDSLSKTGCLIVGTTIPEELKKYIEETRFCIASNKILAAYALCRTILEATVRNIGIKKGLFKKDRENVIQQESRSWSAMKRKVVPKHLKTSVGDIYDKTSALIHGRKTIQSEDTLKMFADTLAVITELYKYYHLS